MSLRSETHALDALAVVLQRPEQLELQRLVLQPPGESDVVVDVQWSGISTGTEKLLWTGRMPPFPGMGYPLVPGYESVGRLSAAGATSGRQVGDQVFVPGARCFGDVRGLFGGAAAKVVVPGSRVIPIDAALGERGVLLALAATAYHAAAARDALQPDLIVGHGVLGRLLARLAIAAGAAPPVVWERNADRMSGAQGYSVLHPDEDPRKDYRSIYDVSGDATILDSLLPRLARGGEIVLAGFYSERPSFAFPAAFLREMRLRVAAEWSEPDLIAVRDLAASGALSLDGLITHRSGALQAETAYRTAFNDAACLKMILDWRACA